MKSEQHTQAEYEQLIKDLEERIEEEDLDEEYEKQIELKESLMSAGREWNVPQTQLNSLERVFNKYYSLIDDLEAYYDETYPAQDYHYHK